MSKTGVNLVSARAPLTGPNTIFPLPPARPVTLSPDCSSAR
jgi:hypothetical protein